MKPLIVIPTYNEVDNISNLIIEINKILSSKYKFAILIVDDASTDGTREDIMAMQNQYNNLFILNRRKKLGLASAYITGFKYGITQGFDTFIEMDADFSHNPIYLIDMLKNLETNDVVIGSRNTKGGTVVGWSKLRNFISKGGSLYSRLILNCPINDLTGGFNGWRLSVLKKINLDKIISKGYAFQIEMKYRAYKKKCKIMEFPIIFTDRKYGESKMNKAIFIEALFNVIKIRLFV